MRKLMLSVFLLIFCSNSGFANIEMNSLNLAKTKKVIQKEEEIAKAYKKYLLKNGKVPNETSDLKDFLPKGFDFVDSFNRNLIVNKKAEINSFNSSANIALDKIYFSNSLREHTEAPISNEKDIKIALKDRELMIFENQSIITTDEEIAKSKESNQNEDGIFYLDSGTLYFYHNKEHIFTLTDDILVNENIDIFKDGKATQIAKKFILNHNGIFAGQKIYHHNASEGTLEQYLNTQNNVIKLNPTVEATEILMKIVPSGAGLIINGDINMWGDNSNYVVGIGKDSSEQVNTLIRVNSIYYDDSKSEKREENSINSQKQLSTIARAKFTDIYFDYKKGLCAISTNEDLYCNGKKLLETFGGQFEGYNTTNNTNSELLYRNSFFNTENLTNEQSVKTEESSNKDRRKYRVKKIFMIDDIYLAMVKNSSESQDGNSLYYWGKNSLAWAGNGALKDENENPILEPKEIKDIPKFSDIAFIQYNFKGTDKRKLFGITPNKELYSWGNITNNSCNIQQGELVINICKPTKVNTEISTGNNIEDKTELNFMEITNGIHYIFAEDSSGVFYKIDSAGNISKVADDIKSDDSDDSEIISFDYSADKIFWINSNKKLKSRTIASQSAATVEKGNNWVKIKVVNERGAMCALNDTAQLYCLGDMRNSDGSSTVIPLFNANQFAENKDFMYGDLKTDYYNLANPTFISGFNYDVIFK